jgi:predicted DNA-binding transcriptional regulator AlpA
MTARTPTELALQLLTDALARAAVPSATVTVTETVTMSAGVTTWTPERLWAAPDLTRLDVTELAAALGVTRSAVHKMVARHELPCRRLPDKSLRFIAADVRAWHLARETVVNAAPVMSGRCSQRRA